MPGPGVRRFAGAASGAPPRTRPPGSQSECSAGTGVRTNRTLVLTTNESTPRVRQKSNTRGVPSAAPGPVGDHLRAGPSSRERSAGQGRYAGPAGILSHLVAKSGTSNSRYSARPSKPVLLLGQGLSKPCCRSAPTMTRGPGPVSLPSSPRERAAQENRRAGCATPRPSAGAWTTSRPATEHACIPDRAKTPSCGNRAAEPSANEVSATKACSSTPRHILTCGRRVRQTAPLAAEKDRAGEIRQRPLAVGAGGSGCAGGLLRAGLRE
jgi:hypothetical protein